jgi:hypothetical protein
LGVFRLSSRRQPENALSNLHLSAFPRAQTPRWAGTEITYCFAASRRTLPQGLSVLTAILPHLRLAAESGHQQSIEFFIGRNCMKRLACAVVIAAGAGVLLSGTAPLALAEPVPFANPGTLQISIESPTALAGSAVSLDVNFRGGDIRSIELYLNGDLIKKQAIRTKDGKGVISFALDGLPEGSHDVLIKAYDVNGNIATTTTRLQVLAEQSDFLAQFVYPNKQNAVVQGIVPLQIKVDKSVKNPYVSFVVGDDFAFINLPPFTYNWDSTKAPNGLHTVNVEIIDGETLAKVKTLTMILNVKNPGGYTNRRTDVQDLSNKNAKPLPLESAVLRAAESVVPQAALNHLSFGGLLSRLNSEFVPTVRGSRAPISGNVPAPTLQNLTGEPTLNLVAPDMTVVRRVTPGMAFANPTVRPTPPTHDVRPSLETPRPTVAGMLAMPTVSGNVLSGTSGIARQSVRVRRAGNVAAMPQVVLGNVAMSVNSTVAHTPTVTKPVSVQKIARTNTVKVAEMKVNGKPIEIAFDNQRIAFDVSPRVEKGIPLAPFRQIFEHTGGKVEWFAQSQTVRATNTQREVEFRVGEKSATVNNRAVSIERTPYIDRGRAIVPLSFVRDALDVKVSFDAATGRLMIESRK